MAKRKEKKYQTLGDYVTMAFSPVLIMTLVGSLVFFLAEVFYAGEYSGRLLYTLFWFVMGMVLITRIQIENADGRAKWYGLGLGLAVYAALNGYVEYPSDSVLVQFRWLINLALIAVIWWATHRLTWDSTFIDDHVDASGMGVLEAAGMDEPVASAEGLVKTEEEPADEPADATKKAESSGWWDRYRQYRNEQAKKPHTPGVWIVYFSLAALPLFGLGQVLIPVEDTDRRHYVFWLFVVYVASGLGLLLTTSYLGLRRYLRQRQLAMPVAMTSVWLSVGGIMIVTLLVLGALLPRPFGEYQLVNFTPLGSPERKASQFALKGDSKAKGEGRGSSDTSKQDPDAKSGDGTQRDAQSKGGKTSSSSGGNKSGNQGSGSGKQGNTQGKSGRDSSKSDQRSDNTKNRNDNDRKDDEPRKDDQQQDDKKDQDESKDDPNKNSSSSKQDSGSRSSKTGSSSSRPPSSSLPSFFSNLGWLATLLKWIVFGILVLVVGFYLLRSGLRFLANFSDWAKRLLESIRAWWESLFGGRKEEAAGVADSDPEKMILKPRPFSTFHDPFLTGSAERMSPNQVVRYSFEALQSWAWERNLGRGAAETPREFVDRLVAEVPGLDREARGLGALYARVAYARGNLGPAALDPLRQFWLRLNEVTERPLSA
jgi:hypothetical protein